MFGPESDLQFTESVSGIVSISGCNYGTFPLMSLPPPQLKSAPTELPAHFPVNKTVHPVKSPPPPTYKFLQLQAHLPVNKKIHPVISPPPPTYKFPQLQAHLPVNKKRHPVISPPPRI